MRTVAKPKMTRRDFLSSAAAAAAGFALAGGLVGSPNKNAYAEENVSSPDLTTGSNSLGNDVEIFDTELLIIGCGQGAIAAAWDALSEGQTVMMVDKAPAHHGGPTSWSWGCYSLLNNPAGNDIAQTTNPILRKNIADYFSKYAEGGMNNAVYQVNRGQVLMTREADGSLSLSDISGQGTYTYFEQYYKHEMDSLATRYGAQVIDNTMITDILINDGVCYGAMGIHLPSGRFRVFRSKATIMGSGAPVWMFGWINTKPASLNGADNTGEVQYACYRHGMGLAEAEVPSYDFYNYYPRVAFGSVTGMDAVIAMTTFDKDGNPAFPDGYVAGYNPSVTLQQNFAMVVDEGRAGELGGLFMSCEIQGGEAWMRRDIAAAQQKYFGRDLTTEIVECIPELFDKGGQPIVDEFMMTEVQGLFDLHGAGSGVQAGTSDCSFNATQIKMNGAYAGHCATQYILEHGDYPTEIDWTPALDEYMRVHELRTRTVDDAIRPHAIREKIQKLTMDFYNISRNGETLQNALAELDRIREEELPKMCCVDQEINCNREWRDAIETTAMLDLSYISAQATLIREESGRHMYRRSDFPEVDPSWDWCYTLCRLVDGDRQVTKETYPSL